MQTHERDQLAWAARRHERLVAEADTARALRGLHGGGAAHRARLGTAALLRSLAARLEPKGPGPVAGPADLP